MKKKLLRKTHALLLTIISLFTLSVPVAYGQQGNISLNLTDVTLNDALAAVKESANYVFFYNNAGVDLNKKVSLRVRNAGIADVMKQILPGHKYTVENNIVVILPVEPQEKIRITGVITDAEGEGVIGASILERGTQNGTISLFYGSFSLETTVGATVQITSIGFVAQEIKVGNQRTFTITLKEDTKLLDEVVVIGYGTMRKKDLTGAVGSVTGDALTNRKTTQLSTALQGTMSGVTITRNNNAPGASADIRIRGITTISESSPLIVVDGVPVNNINDVNPNDVENISVLKDAASAAIYGARAAAGVILITTKRGSTDKFSMDYTFEYGVEIPTTSPKYVGATRFMEMTNELRWNDAGNGADQYPTYGKDIIENYDALHTENPNKYPNTDWQGMILKGSAPRQSHVLSFSGGSKMVRSKVTLAYDKVDGLYNNKNYNRVSVRNNNDFKLNDMISASLDVYIKGSKYHDPVSSPLTGMRQTPAVYAAVWQDGRIAEAKSGDNPYAYLNYGGTKDEYYYQAGGRASLDFTPFKGFKASAVIAPTYNFEKKKNFRKRVEYYAADNPTQLMGTVYGHATTKLEENRNDNHSNTMQFLLNYETQLGEHALNLMAGYESYYYFNESLSASRDKYELDSYPYLKTGPLELRANDGSAYENAYRSYFARAIYSYKDKYLLQANVRRDGSSRFHKDHRWGTFPSFSAGWVMSEENFMKNVPVLDFLKLRISWGSLGNERIGNYPYQALLSFYNALFYQGNSVGSELTAAQVQYAIQNITWETTESWNYGFDLTLLNNRLRVGFDYYNKKTKDMLLDLEIPGYVGYSNPSQNAGQMTTKGFDLELGWNDRIGDWSYGVSVNISDYVSKMGDMKGTQFLGDQVKMEGSEFNEWYGYLSDGIYQTQEEVDNSAKLNNSVKPGDIRYKDVSGPDGTPDGVINDYDKVLLGGSMPRYSYGANLNLGYKGFDFAMTLQGVGKQNVRMDKRMVQPLIDNWANIPELIDGKYWSHYNTEEQNMAAKYPRLTNTNSSNNYAMSDFWIFNGRYLRLKNITLGYTLPEALTQKISIKRARVYISASDLFCLSGYPKGWDPEMGVNSYPITTTIVGGISVNF